jgi:hypothetical protein
MPFSTYLSDDYGGTTTEYSYHEDPQLGIDSSTFSNSVQFQIPHFMLNEPPTLAMGGGAEVVPAGMFNDPATIASSWFINNGFNTKSLEGRWAYSVVVVAYRDVLIIILQFCSPIAIQAVRIGWSHHESGSSPGFFFLLSPARLF